MSSVKERPILFSAPMVRAILDGRKTVTRRPVKGSALKWLEEFAPEFVALSANELCPFGQIGDRLYVRETCFINDYREAAVPEGERADCEIHYRADGVPDFEGEEELIRWRPSIHMPRWASRILLEITDVRVERLQEITYEQAAAEGVHRGPLREWCASDEGGACHQYPIPAFRDLWQSTGGDWDANPWVWVVEFKRVTP